MPSTSKSSRTPGALLADIVLYYLISTAFFVAPFLVSPKIGFPLFGPFVVTPQNGKPLIFESLEIL